MRLSEQEYAELIHKRSLPKRKYGNEPTMVDGIKFDSKKEAAKYSELKEMERRGLISNLRLQVRYELLPAVTLGDSTRFRAKTYKADFVFNQDGTEKVLDVKSPASKTQAYNLRRHLMKFIHDIDVIEC